MKEGIKQLRKDLKKELRAVKLIESAISTLSKLGGARKPRKAKKAVEAATEEAPRRKRKAAIVDVDKAA